MATSGKTKAEADYELGLGDCPVVIEELLRSGVKRGLVNCTRQWGKSTLAVMAASGRFQPKSLIVVKSSPTEKQSAERL